MNFSDFADRIFTQETVQTEGGQTSSTARIDLDSDDPVHDLDQDILAVRPDVLLFHLYFL